MKMKKITDKDRKLNSLFFSYYYHMSYSYTSKHYIVHVAQPRMLHARVSQHANKMK